MTKQQIEQLAKMPLSKLAELCQDPGTLAVVMNLARYDGLQEGREQTHRFYRRMFTGYQEATKN